MVTWYDVRPAVAPRAIGPSRSVIKIKRYDKITLSKFMNNYC
jgi:hypothetical protein